MNLNYTLIKSTPSSGGGSVKILTAKFADNWQERYDNNISLLDFVGDPKQIFESIKNQSALYIDIITPNNKHFYFIMSTLPSNEAEDIKNEQFFTSFKPVVWSSDENIPYLQVIAWYGFSQYEDGNGELHTNKEKNYENTINTQSWGNNEFLQYVGVSNN